MLLKSVIDTPQPVLCKKCSVFRERALALERVEKERQEMEQKKEKELQQKREMERHRKQVHSCNSLNTASRIRHIVINHLLAYLIVCIT